MDKRIEDFICSQFVFTLCTAVNNVPYCATCMYAYLRDEHVLVFSSEESTRHIKEALVNPDVAGTILPAKVEMTTVRGIQFTGKFISLTQGLKEQARKIYYSKYPFALAMKGELWLIEIENIKMTDNTLGFGKKIVWNKYSERENENAR